MKKITIRTGVLAAWVTVAVELALIIWLVSSCGGCHGLMVDDRTEELNGFGRAFVRTGEFSDRLGVTEVYTLDEAHPAPQSEETELP